MANPLTADEILPLVAALSPQEKARLLRLIVGPASADAAYRSNPPTQDEFTADHDQLAWDAGGWETFG
ncbi:MAG: hypothetical protein SFV15_14700 [Polyangiaceae bacterium]|nr:hypothetical protein [Polyangiaceae bacterium]